MKRAIMYGRMSGKACAFIGEVVSDYLHKHDGCLRHLKTYGDFHELIVTALMEERNMRHDNVVDMLLLDIPSKIGKWWYRELAAYAVTDAIDMLTLYLKIVGIKGLLT